MSSGPLSVSSGERLPVLVESPGHRTGTWIQAVGGVLPYLAVAVAFMGSAVTSAARGWLPTSDDAIFAWRSWNVLSAHPPLLGAPTHGYGTTHQVFAPGPILFWLLAIPTHLDPRTGPLLGAALIASALSMVAIWAARSWGGPLAGLITALGIILVCAAEPTVALYPIWTPWFGTLAFVALLTSALASMAGNLRACIAVGVTATFASQAHVIFILPSAVIAVGSVAFGLVVATKTGSAVRTRLRPLWLAAALVVLLWLPTIIEQLADAPGNLALLWQARHSGGSPVGLAFAFHGLASAVAWNPSWLHQIPRAGFVGEFEEFNELFGASSLWAIATAVLLTWAAVRGFRRQRTVLRNMALVCIAGGFSVTLAVSLVPARDAAELTYLAIAFMPIGILCWSTVAVLLVDLVARQEGRFPIHHHGGSDSAVRWSTVVASGVLIVATALLCVRLDSEIPSASVLGGSRAALLTNQVVRGVERIAPKNTPFQLGVTGATPGVLYAVHYGAAFQLHANGLIPQFPQPSANEQIGLPTAPKLGLPVVTCNVDTGHCRRVPHR